MPDRSSLRPKPIRALLRHAGTTPSLLWSTTLTLALALAVTLPVTAGAQGPQLEQAQARLDAGDAEGALPLIEQAMGRGKARGRALFLRSTARFMLGEHDAAKRDLRQALDIDPALRQGWLNLAAAEMAVEKWDAAYEALTQAEKLDPTAPDNDLNLGAVQLLRGRREDALARFAAYLADHASDADAYYQVASNFAVAGDPVAAIEHLRQAVVLNERIRMRIRGDSHFDYYHLAVFQQLLDADVFVAPPGTLRASAAFPEPYDTEHRLLLEAVLAALRELRIPYEPTIEASRSWALVWGLMRIKVGAQSDGTGVVTATASPDRFERAAFHRQTQRLFRAIHDRLTVLRFRR